MLKTTQKKILQKKKNLNFFFFKMKSATQKTPETEKSFQSVSLWSNNKQKTAYNIANWPLAGASEICSQQKKCPF